MAKERKLTVTPPAKAARGARFKKAVQKTGRKNAELFRRLAK